jgi:hypothetical protein
MNLVYRGKWVVLIDDFVLVVECLGRMSFKRHGLKLFWEKCYIAWLLKGCVMYGSPRIQGCFVGCVTCLPWGIE